MKVIELSENEFFNKINEIDGKILVDCYAPWCGPCRMLSPIIDDLAEEISDCTFYKINVDNALELSKKYAIMSIPTILIFENKKLKEKLIGLKSREVILEVLNK